MRRFLLCFLGLTALAAAPARADDAAAPCDCVTTTGLRGSVGTGGAAAPAAPAGLRRSLPDDPLAEDDPFAFSGYRSGGLLWFPSLDAALGRTSNIEGKAGGTGGTFLKVTPELALRSDWSRHALEASGSATFNRYPGLSDQNNASYAGAAKLRLDLMDGMQADLAARLSSARGAASSADNPAGTAVPSTALTRGASLGFTRDAGLIGVTLRGDVDRTTYSGGMLASGAAIATDSLRNNTRVALALRGSYDTGAAVSPYVEGQVFRRDYDAAANSGRDSTGAAMLVGATVDLGPILRGDLNAGLTREQARDGTLPTLGGFTLDGRLTWMPTRLTTVDFSARTTVDPTSLAGSSGSIGHEMRLALAESLRRDLTASVAAKATRRSYTGIDRSETTVGAEAELAWRVDTHAEVYGRGEWTRFRSSTPAEAYQSFAIMAGLRLR